MELELSKHFFQFRISFLVYSPGLFSQIICSEFSYLTTSFSMPLGVLYLLCLMFSPSSLQSPFCDPALIFAAPCCIFFCIRTKFWAPLNLYPEEKQFYPLQCNDLQGKPFTACVRSMWTKRRIPFILSATEAVPFLNLFFTITYDFAAVFCIPIASIASSVLGCGVCCWVICAIYIVGASRGIFFLRDAFVFPAGDGRSVFPPCVQSHVYNFSSRRWR